jgi:hypothetical protein
MKAFLSLLLLAVSFAGCAGQGEGDLCNRLAGNNGNDDCQNGLECDTTVSSTQGFGRCCPGDRALATTVICKGSSGGIDASPAPPAPADGNPPDVTADDDAGATE